MHGLEKVIIVADKVMSKLGITQRVIDQLIAREGHETAAGQAKAVQYRIIDDVEPEPSIDTVEAGVKIMTDFEPDTVIAVGGGSVMDAAKIMRLRYEHPDIAFADMREKFFDIRKRAFTIPSDSKVRLVCIPTTSGTGSEVTPFAVITDHKTGYKYPIADYALTPDVAIVDPEFAKTQPQRVACDSGFDAMTHCIEAYVSVYANDYTDGLALHGLKLAFDNIYAAAIDGDEDAKVKMHNAATLAGMAFGSGMLGVCHGISHTLGAVSHTAHGRSNAILLPTVIRYNAEVPVKPTSWPKYATYNAAERYAAIAKHLGVKFDEKKPETAADALATALEKLRDKLGMPASYQDAGVTPELVFPKLDAVAMRIYEDQCTPANPRVPILEEIKDIVYAAFYGVSRAEGAELRAEAGKGKGKK
jgi:acetaldehyde dehydrogenase/alcohol dehydrogenase